MKPISVAGTRRIVRFAFEYVKANRRRTITVGHKASIMPTSDGLFLRTAKEHTSDRGDVAFEDMQIDHLTARLVREPGRFDVLLLPNLYGDILSDLCADSSADWGSSPERTSAGSTRSSSRCTAARRTSPAGASRTRSR